MFTEKFIYSKESVNIFIISPELFFYLFIEEILQSNRFTFDCVKERYVVLYGLLRVLLGQYLSLPSSQIEYTFNEFQKPFCKNDPSLYFNMPHCENYACYVFSYNYQIGIDIEYINKELEIKDILNSIATPKEIIEFILLFFLILFLLKYVLFKLL